MDKFEREYFEKLRDLASNYQNIRHELAKSRIKMLAAAIARQILYEKQEFDLIISGGNSGIFATKIAEIALKKLDVKIPQIINVPVVRIAEKNKNMKAIYSIPDHIDNLNGIENVLFVDEEIMSATTAKSCLDLLFAEKPDTKHINLTIVAENHFFEWHHFVPKASVRFFPYARLIQGLNGNIGYFIPNDLYENIASCLPQVKSYNEAMAVVIGGALETKNHDKPYFDFKIEKILFEKIENYENTKNKLLNELEELVFLGVNGYKSGEIRFRF